MSAKHRQVNDSPERLRELQRKFTDGTATPQEKVAWLMHLKSKAQQQGNDSRVLALVQQMDAAHREDVAQATQPLPCPDGSPRQLAWIRTTDVRARRAPAVPAPEREAVNDLADSIKAQGVLQNLVLGPEHDVIVGEGRRQAARQAGVPYVPALVLTEVTAQERELMALAADIFTQSRLSLRQLARYRAAYRTVIGHDSMPHGQHPTSDRDPLPAALDLVQSYHQLPEAQQREVADMILEGMAAQEAVQTALQQHAARKAVAPQVQTLQQRLRELDQRLALVEGERNALQDTARQLETQLGLAHGQLVKAQDDVTSLAEATAMHKQESTKLSREIRTLRDRLAQLRPLEQLGATPHTIDVMSEAVQLIELVYGRLLRGLSALLDSATAQTSTKDCLRVLDDIVAHATACKRALAKVAR